MRRAGLFARFVVMLALLAGCASATTVPTSSSVLARIRAIREERYSLFRGFFHGATDAADAAENLQSRLHTILLTQRSKAVGKSLAEIGLGKIVEVTGVRRHGSRSVIPKAEDRFEEGDVVVLLGKPANLALAEHRLHQG